MIRYVFSFYQQTDDARNYEHQIDVIMNVLVKCYLKSEFWILLTFGFRFEIEFETIPNWKPLVSSFEIESQNSNDRLSELSTRAMIVPRP